MLPGDGGFAATARPNNLRYAARRPGVIAVCADAADVSASIVWAREHGVPFVARSSEAILHTPATRPRPGF